MSESVPTRRAQREAAETPGPLRVSGGVEDPREIGATEWRPAQGIPAATVAAAPRRTAPITGTPAFAPSRVEQPSAGAGPEAARIGWDAARPSLAAAGGPIRPLENASDVLPELEEAQVKPRPMWKHPAFLVSAGTTVLALIALVVFVILGVMNPRPTASALSLAAGDDSVRVSWSGPDVAYQVIVVGGPGGDQLDVSQLVTGTEAWIPVGAGLIDDRSCVVVRPAAGNEEAPVALDAATVSAQGGASACVTDG